MPKSTSSQRPIDVEVEESYSWLSKSFAFIQKSQIKTWHAIFLAAFLGGVAFAFGMTVSLNLQMTSQAAPIPIPERMENILSRKLLVSVDPGSPAEKYLTMNTQNEELAQFQLQAESELPLKVSKILIGNRTSDFQGFSNIGLYHGNKLLEASLAFENRAGVGIAEFSNFNLIIPEGQSTTLRIVADVNQMGTAVSGATHQIFLPVDAVEYVEILPYREKIPGEVKYKKVPSEELSANKMTVYATNLKVSLNPSSPSGIRAAGSSSEIARYDFSTTSSFGTSVKEISFKVNATGAPITGKGTFVLKDNYNTTFANVNLNWTEPFEGTFTLSNPLLLSSLSPQTLRIYMDTTGFTVNQTLKLELTNWVWSDGLSASIQPLSTEVPVLANELLY